MSSHHVVRDEQEPALLIMSNEYDKELLGNLLEWSPTVILTTSVVSSNANIPHKLDVVIGETSTMAKSKALLKYQEPIKYIEVNHQSDLLIESLRYLKSTNYNAVNIIGIAPSSQFPLLELLKMDIVFYFNRLKWYFIRGHFKKWLPKNHAICWKGKGEITFAEKTLEVKKCKLFSESEGFLEIDSKNGMWLGEAI